MWSRAINHDFGCAIKHGPTGGNYSPSDNVCATDAIVKNIDVLIDAVGDFLGMSPYCVLKLICGYWHYEKSEG